MVQRWFMNRVAFPLLSLFGRAHDLGSGAQRYLDVLLDEEKFISGRFYASPWPTTSGELIDQASIFPPLFNTDYQDAAYEAVQRILSGELRGAGEPRGQEEVRAAA